MASNDIKTTTELLDSGARRTTHELPAGASLADAAKVSPEVAELFSCPNRFDSSRIMVAVAFNEQTANTMIHVYMISTDGKVAIRANLTLMEAADTAKGMLEAVKHAAEQQVEALNRKR